LGGQSILAGSPFEAGIEGGIARTSVRRRRTSASRRR